MRSSSDGPRTDASGTSGAWARLAVLLAIVVLLLLSPAVASTSALLTDTTSVVGVVSTLEVFPTTEPTPEPTPTG